MFFQEYESLGIVKGSPVVAPPQILRKSTRQKAAPSIYKPDPSDSPQSLKRKAFESPPKQPAKVPKSEPVFTIEPVNGSPQIKKEVIVESPKSKEVSLLKKTQDSVIAKPAVQSLLKPLNPAVAKAPDVSLLRTSLLKPELKQAAVAIKTPDLPSSITLSPVIPNLPPVTGLFRKTTLAEMPTKPDPKTIDEVNNSWAESLLSKSKRPKGSFPISASTSLTNSVTLQRVIPSQGVTIQTVAPKFPTASIVAVAVNGTSPMTTPIPAAFLPTSPLPLSNEEVYADFADESDDDGEPSMMFEPQVILNTSSQDDHEMTDVDEGVAEEDEAFVEEFCDVCSMELINHADEQPCDPDENYVKVYKSCRVCDAPGPTREHVSRHFLSELLEVVDCFPNPLACTQCDYQGETTTTVALHAALVHGQVDEILQDDVLVSRFTLRYCRAKHISVPCWVVT